MKRKVLKHLKEYIKKNVYSDYTLYSLFQEYEKNALISIDGLQKATKDFINFLTKHKYKILKDLPNSKFCQFNEEFDKILIAFKYFSTPKNVDSIYTFVKLAESLYDNKQSKILDVGSGGIPLSSFLFTTSFEDVYSMDKFLLSNDFLKAQNITPINDYFDSTTNVTNYDYVVGQCPCSAIPYIIQNCAKENKPYFIELCNCSLKNIELKDGSHPFSWQEVVYDYDSNITYLEPFVFNIDATQSQIIKNIEGNGIHESLNISSSAIKFLSICFNELIYESSFQKL